MTVDEILGLAKAAKAEEQAVFGRYRLTLADLGRLRLLRQMRRTELRARVRQLSAMYGGAEVSTKEQNEDERVVLALAAESEAKRARSSKQSRKDALSRFTKG